MKANDQVPPQRKASQPRLLLIDAVRTRLPSLAGVSRHHRCCGDAGFRPVASSLCDREPGEVNRARGNDLDTDAEKQEGRQAGNNPSPFLSDELGKPIGVAVAE